MATRPSPSNKPTAEGETIMAKVVRVIEVLAQSEKSWEDAAKNALEEAKKTLRRIRSIYVKEFEAKVENDEITEYRINAKVTFELESDRPAAK
jgi:flavin-binding protein dodecin